MVQTIHASVKGRARYKIKGLHRSESLKKYLEFRLAEKEGINRFHVNAITGNILVFFNSNNDVNTIASVIEGIVIEYKEQNHCNASAIGYEADCRDSLPLRGEAEAISKKEIPRFVRNDILKRRKLRRAIVRAKEQIVEQWHLMESASVLDLFGVNKSNGLSHESAKENLKKYGPNILPESVPRSGLSIFIDQFKSLPVALLGVAAGISIATGGLADAAVILGVVTINAAIGYFTESHAEKTIHSLKSLVRPSALVIRDGNIKEIGAEQAVPGDILVLRPGSYVAADARLIEAHHLSIDESALTGESMPVLKIVESLELRVKSDADIPLADRVNMVYMGTLVTGGQGLAVVVATGRFTEIGKIQTLVGEAKPPETPMERQLSRMGTQLVIISGVVCGVVFIIGLIRGYGFLQMLKTSISLAVAAVPEGLPTVATTTLALGIRNMKRHNVLIRRLDAVETLGSVQVICLDKTGTITLNKMSVVEIYTGMRRLRLHDGKFFISENDNQTMQSKQMYRREHVSPYFCDELLRLIHVCALCNESGVSKNEDGYIVNGSPTENALIYAAISSGVDIFMLREKYPLLKIQHRSENRNYMATIHNIKSHDSKNQHGKVIAIKGSPTEVLSMCVFYMRDGKKFPLSDEERLKIEIENERMAGNALRVLGVAYAFIDEGIEKVGSKQYAVSGEENNYYQVNSTDIPLDSQNLIWLGLVGMADPIRDGVKELIHGFHRAGIDTVMITGDQSPTAYAIGKELDLGKGGQLEILDSTHLTDIEPDVMKAICERVHVFSRVSPAHKLQIVQALQSAGRVVAMTGDGINDGPALKAADIGVAMGHAGTDVAREVADVVLEDDNMETMIIAISQGRTIYNNIRKSVHFLLSTNLSEIMVMFTAIAGGLGQPLSAMQLLWINLISDIAPGLALGLEPAEPDVLSRPPRDPDDPIIKSSDFKRIAFESAVLSTGTLGAYGYGIMRYGMGQKAGTMAFMSLTTGQILHAISCRSEKHSIFDRGKLPPNKYLNVALVGSLALQVLSMAVPGLRSLLGIAPINIIDGIVIGGSAAAPLLVNEATKQKLLE
ncbi:cation-translocating P-type ATPase [Dissulfurispira sp.]|uniref:cation-translocating P-type ATPase n=1 Tax=Dissulfurispira sp. TaxID=2817609 RepID=UPI002FDA6F50